MKEKKLIFNTLYLYILSIIKMIFPLLTLPYLTRILTVETYGVVVYVKAYMSYIQLILDYGFLFSATKNIAIAYNNKNSKQIEYILGNTIIEKIILCFFSLIITFFLSNFIPILKENLLFIWLYFFAISLSIFITDFLFRGIEKMEYITVPYVCAKAIFTALTFILIKNDKDLLLIPILEIISNIIIVIISILIIRKLKIHFKFQNLKKWIEDLKHSGLYFLSNFATTIFGSLTTLIIGIVMSSKEVAFWSISMQIVGVAKSMYTPICNSIYPYMIIKKNIKIIKKIQLLMLFPMIIGTIVVLFYGERIMSFIGGTNYKDAGYVLKFLLPTIIVSFYSMLYGWPVLGALGRVKETTFSTIIAACIQLIGIIFIYKLNLFSLKSLAISCNISETFLLIIRWKYFKSYIKK